MEILFIILAVLFIMWVGGFFRSLREISDMANNQITGSSATHKVKVVNKLSTLDVDADKAEKAKSTIALLDSIEL